MNVFYLVLQRMTKNDQATREESDQHGYPPSRISLHCPLNDLLGFQSFYVRTVRLIRQITGHVVDFAMRRLIYAVLPPGLKPLRKHTYSNILKIFPPKNEIFQIKKSDIFSYFCSNHRLWVLDRTASTRRF